MKIIVGLVGGGRSIPNQSSGAMAFKEFDESGRMRPSSYYDRIVDLVEELI